MTKEEKMKWVETLPNHMKKAWKEGDKKKREFVEDCYTVDGKLLTPDELGEWKSKVDEEIWGHKMPEPDIKKVWCKDCAMREPDRLDGQIKGATLRMCVIYDWKPDGILWKYDECPYYFKGEPDMETEEYV